MESRLYISVHFALSCLRMYQSSDSSQIKLKNAYALAIDKMLNRELDRLYVVFPAYEPEETFTGILTEPEDVGRAVLEYGHLTVVDLGHFILNKISGQF